MISASSQVKFIAWRVVGLLACMLALVSQLALGSVVLPEAVPPAQLAALDAAMVDCAPGPPGAPPAPFQRDHQDTALCPLSVALDQPAMTIAPAPVLPTPDVAAAVPCGSAPPACAPSAVVVAAAYPRGPPNLA